MTRGDEVTKKKKKKKKDFLEKCWHENSDMIIEKVEAVISKLGNNSAPSSEEKILT